MRTWRCLVEHHLDPCAQWMLDHQVAPLIPGGHPRVALQTWVQYTRSMKVGVLHLFTICSIPDFQFFTSNSVRDFKCLMMLNDNFLWLMNLHTDIKNLHHILLKFLYNQLIQALISFLFRYHKQFCACG